MPGFEEISIMPLLDGTMSVYAWCVTCNVDTPPARFALGVNALDQLVEEARDHLASAQHTAARDRLAQGPADGYGPHYTAAYLPDDVA